jgi:hypothetical protein
MPGFTDTKAPSISSGESRLEALFKADLQYRSESESDADVAAEGREGVYIGSGDGTVAGDRLRGTIRWSLWSGNCFYPLARSGQSVPEGLHLCTINPAGFIEAQDWRGRCAAGCGRRRTIDSGHRAAVWSGHQTCRQPVTDGESAHDDRRFTRYSRAAAFAVLRREQTLMCWMVAGSFLGAVLGGLLLGFASAGPLMTLLAVVLLVSPVRIFQHAR